MINTVRFTRGLFGKPRDDAYLERAAAPALALGQARRARSSELSGGMMRRVLIAKALSHQPRVLFLDEPTAGVDVELRKGMWEMVRDLRAAGTTIILTTHYIEEAEAIADRVAVINGGRILLVEDKATLMRRMGRKQHDDRAAGADRRPSPRRSPPYRLDARRRRRAASTYAYDRAAERTGIISLLRDLSAAGLVLRDVQTRQNSLEDIFVDLVREEA